ncbi:hypothetical protein CHELA1G11_20622 [Hyphomicrobiales bacterium]|nr:hypothetical protein CHELA1G11_20622 [Hyphomicrobiales bacterium]
MTQGIGAYSDGGVLPAIFAIRPCRRTCRAAVASGQRRAAGAAPEIWTLWDQAARPHSVGPIDRVRNAPLQVDNLPLGSSFRDGKLRNHHW